MMGTVGADADKSRSRHTNLPVRVMQPGDAGTDAEGMAPTLASMRRALVAIALTASGLAAGVPGGSGAAASTYQPYGCAGPSSNSQGADAVMAGDIVVSGFGTVHIGTGAIDWSMNPYHSSSFRRTFFGLAWLQELLGPYQKYGPGAHPEYLARAKSIIDDFAAHNPPDGGVDPADSWSPMYAATREAQIACVGELEGSPLSSLQPTGTWLANSAHDPGDWNQGVVYNLGLLAAGCDTDNGTWVSHAVSRLSSLATSTIDSQGAMHEQAPGYGALLGHVFVQAQMHLNNCTGGDPTAISSRLPLLYQFLGWSTAPTGLLDQLGDTYALSPPAPPVYPEAAGTASEWAATKGASGAHPSPNYAVYSSGWGFGRSTWDPFASSSYYSLRWGAARAFHGHNDHDSLDFYAAGNPLLVDSGFDGYTSGTFRDYLRSPLAHNVLVVPGLAFNPDVGTSLAWQQQGTNWQSYRLVDKAYGGRTRTRVVMVQPSAPFAVVLDTASRGSTGPFQQLWHLPIGAKTATYSTSGIATTANGRESLHIVQLSVAGHSVPRSSVHVVKGATSPYQGWVSTASGKRVAAPVFELARSGTSAAIATVLVAAAPSVAVHVSSVRGSDGWYTISIAIGAAHYSVRMTTASGGQIVGA